MAISQLSFGQDLTVFDFDAVSPTFSGKDTLKVVANPHSDAINSSALVGEYKHYLQWSDLNCPADVDSRIYTSYSISVYVPAATGSGIVAIACYDAKGTQLDWYQPSSISSTGAWVTLTRNYTFASKIAKVLVSFNRASTALETTGDVVYFDNLVFHKTTSTSITLYNETFFASWSQWADWNGLASAQTGKWAGGVNLTAANDSVYISKIWNDAAHSFGLKLNPTKYKDATIAPITNLTGFKNMQLSIDVSWPWSSAENNGFFAATGSQKSISINYKTDINNDGVIDSNDGDWIATPDTLKQAWATKLIPLPAGTKTVALQFTAATCLYTATITNVKIVGEVDNNAGVTSALANNIALYPNPTSDILHVSGDFEKIDLVSINGSTVISAKTNRINIGSLPQGLYIAKIYTATGVFNQKIMKK
jgi:hypothetical protein